MKLYSRLHKAKWRSIFSAWSTMKKIDVNIKILLSALILISIVVTNEGPCNTWTEVRQWYKFSFFIPVYCSYMEPNSFSIRGKTNYLSSSLIANPNKFPNLKDPMCSRFRQFGTNKWNTVKINAQNTVFVIDSESPTHQ